MFRGNADGKNERFDTFLRFSRYLKMTLYVLYSVVGNGVPANNMTLKRTIFSSQ